MGVLDDFPDGLERVPQGGVTDGPLMVEDRPPFEPERQWYNVTNVKDFGAFGNGQDDSERIQEAIEATPDGGVIYFPREVPLGAYEFAVEVNGRHCLTFIGDGCSKLRWLGTALALIRVGGQVRYAASFACADLSCSAGLAYPSAECLRLWL